ncbi:methionine ABC transporter ATP-binding protein [Granulicoccus phenolivorans]|uniref:methionine ABC transporter ATP-binding protein n=1 Tax=Granulicoccus phenolivorans TaxID=266854 RepID=UPI000405C9C2|nr:ATP-binding cassette domain-containing protein [Granulicoccus phenolivorans]
MIEVSHLTKVYPGRRNTEPVLAVDDLSLEVERGHVMGLIGPSGSGKSTLGRCLTLLERPTSGTITVDGVELTGLGGAQLRQARRAIGMIFQAFNLMDARSALGNVELPLQIAGVAAGERRRRAMDLLERVGLAEKASVHPRHLSGGQQQRVAIARALVNRPSVLISDESTSALDHANTQAIIALLRDLTDELGLTTVLISHQLEVVRDICDEVAVLDTGRIVRTAVRDEQHVLRYTNGEAA